MRPTEGLTAVSEGMATGSSSGGRGRRLGAPTVLLASFVLLLLRAPELAFYMRFSDPSYHLSLARQVLLGRKPFVDLFFHYGPMTAFASAAVMAIHDSLLSETVLAALGWAAAVSLVFAVVRGRAGLAAAAFAATAALFLLPHFYKWYYWLWPLAVLWALAQALAANGPGRRRALVAAGLAGGIGGLFRFDLALMAAAVLAVALSLLLPDRPPLRERAVALGVAGLSLAAPFSIWLAVLLSQGGPTSVSRYFDATLSGAVGSIAEWSTPIPRVHWPHVFARSNGGAAAYAVVPAIYLACLAAGLWLWRKERRDDGAFLLLVGAAGAALFPQALHRSDATHLLQVVPPAIVGAATLWPSVRRALVKPGERAGWPLRSSACLGLLALGGAVWNLSSEACDDLCPPGAASLQRLMKLEAGLAQAEGPVADLIRTLRRETDPGDRILVVPIAFQIVYFADRPVSGYLTGYEKGILDDERWRKLDIMRVREAPPVLVVAHAGFLNGKADQPFLQRQPKLARLLRKGYRRQVGSAGDWVLLAP